MEHIDVGPGRLRGVPALDQLWSCIAREVGGELVRAGDGPQNDPVQVAGDGLVAAQVGAVRFAHAVAGLMGSESRAPIDPARVVPTHGARNGLCHALVTLPADAPVYFPAVDPSAAVAILRSGHRPVPLAGRTGASVAEMLEGIRRLPRGRGGAGLVLHFPSKPAGVTPTAGEWEEVVALSDRFLVVLDDVYGFLDPCPRPLAALIEAGGVVVDSCTIRLGAPGLRLGWLVTGGDRLEVARESVACESGGLATPLLGLGARVLERYVASGVRTAVRAEIDRRRRDLREAIAPDLTRRLVLGEHGFYAALNDAGRLGTVPGLGVQQGPGFVRLCLGAHDDFGAVARRLNDAPLLMGL